MVRKFVFGLILIVFAMACSKEKSKEAALEAKPAVTPAPVNQMPAFEITQTDGKKVAFRSLTGKVLMVLFNPSCDHCQREAKMISENTDLVKGYEVYFISPEPLDSIAKFSYEYKLLDHNMHFGQGNGPQIIQAIGPVNEVPSFFVFNNQTLVARKEGEMTLEKMREFLK
jgi:peroxiredoxin